MNVSVSPLLEERVSAVLVRTAEVEHTGYCRWELRIGGENRTICNAELDGDWLLLECPLDRQAAVDPCKMLHLNACLSGLAKYAVSPGKSAICARAEVPIDLTCETSKTLTATIEGLSAAQEMGSSKQEGNHYPLGAAYASEPSQSTIAAGLCKSGWRIYERPGGSLVVDLETPGRFHQAAIEQATGQPYMRISYTYGNCDPSVELQSRALAVFLLRLNGALRMVRGCLAEDQGQTNARCEVVLPADPEITEVNRALQALSAAAALSGTEAALLASEEVAKRYLAAAPLCGDIKARHGRKGEANSNERH